MREILFRGKRTCGGDWVVGNAKNGYYGFHGRKDSGIACMITQQNFLNAGAGPHACGETDYFVNPHTVGQFIGMLDKNGKRIFEGDLISIEFENDHEAYENPPIWHETAEVVWSQEHFGWFAKFSDEEMLSMSEYNDSSIVEVIGNIHDRGKENG